MIHGATQSQDTDNPFIDPTPTSDNIVCDFDYSDAPSWALPREWVVNGLYDLENEII